MEAYTYMSFGSGVQSTCMLAMADAGYFHCDQAYFADTGDEPPWVYENLQECMWRAKNIRINVVSKGCLSEDILSPRGYQNKMRWANIPLWTRGKDGRAAPLRRQCTREYKIEPIEHAVRAHLGYKRRQRTKHKITALIGISLDEADRMKDNPRKHWDNEWPLIDRRMTRGDCAAMLRHLGWTVPKKSSCSYCPYHSNDTFLELKRDHPETWARVVKLDHGVRNFSKAGAKNPCFIHRSLKPIDEADLGERQGELFSEECEGGCFL